MATAKITEESAASFQWRGKPYYMWDSELKGFGVWVWGADSARAYIVQIKQGKRQFRKSLGKVGEITQKKARDEAIKFRGAVKEGRDPRAEEKAERGAWTLDDAMTYFAGSYADARKHSVGYRTNYAMLYRNQTPDRWKTMRLADISQAMIVARHGEITGGVVTAKAKKGAARARGGSKRANDWLRLMSCLFERGMAQGHCPANPTTGIKKNEETQRERFLSERELATLWEYLAKHKNVEAAVCVQFILLTGCRPGEAYTMRWTDLDKNTGIWRKPASTTKQRKQHVVRLADQASAVLGRLDTWKRSAFVFPCPNDARKPRKDKLRAFWRTACQHCGLSDVRLYDCRHSFASWLAMGGATESAIADLLGHSNTQTTRRYVHLAQEHLREKAGLMGDVISRALADYSPDQRPLVAERGDGGKVTTFLRETAVPAVET